MKSVVQYDVNIVVRAMKVNIKGESKTFMTIT